ncbi:MAG: hypothetical protein LBJ67_16035 [Planctomycetaceae bacterium]|jgi:hypothetical protein|nr:hypothetical protein [Planctomycetaceae bacterium]
MAFYFRTLLVLQTLFLLGISAGCACFYDRIPGIDNVPPAKNPMYIASNDADMVWDRVVDAVDDYFEIEREEPVRLYGSEGRIDTHPRIAATYLEPWFSDSVTAEERLESTCQTIRRRATVRVVPENIGFSIFVSVYKELEDMQRPLGSNSGTASFTYTNTINTINNNITDAPVSSGWISQGRDPALEQRILLKIRYNLENQPMTVY